VTVLLLSLYISTHESGNSCSANRQSTLDCIISLMTTPAFAVAAIVASVSMSGSCLRMVD
jgi:hypothetical protein